MVGPATGAQQANPPVAQIDAGAVIDALRDASPDDRGRLAGQAIDRSRTEPAVAEGVADLLREADSGLRRSLWLELANTPAPPDWAVEAASRELRALAQAEQPDAQVCSAAAATLAAAAIESGPGGGALAVLREIALSESSNDSARRAAIAAFGRVPWRESVDALNALLAPTRPPAQRRQAAAALADLTAASLPGDDVEGALALSQERLSLNEADFAQAAAADMARVALRSGRRARSAATTVVRLAQGRYATADAVDRPTVLASMLADAAPELREAAAAIAVDEAGFGTALGEEVARLLRESISDASPRVRLLAARHARLRNDAQAAALLVAQLRRESSPAARLEQVEALAPMRNVQAVPALLDRLDDASPGVRRRAAAVASDTVHAVDSAAADAVRPVVVARLRDAWQASRNTGDRQAMLEALAPLRDESLPEFWEDMLLPRDGQLAPARVRELALIGLAAQRDPRWVEFAAASMDDADPQVRRAAVTTLGLLGGVGRMAQLERAWDPAREDDPEVRRAAWQAFVRLLPAASTEQLAIQADRFREPEKKLEVLRELTRRAERANDLELLADRRHQMADLLIDAPDRRREAAELYELALEQELARLDAGPPSGESPVANARMKGAMTAYLTAGALDEAARLGESLLSERPRYARDVGSAVLAAARALRDAGQRDAADAVAAAALTWSPPLDDLTQSQLVAFRRDLR